MKNTHEQLIEVYKSLIESYKKEIELRISASETQKRIIQTLELKCELQENYILFLKTVV